MKQCQYCGYDFEHKEATCKALVAEKKEEPKVRIVGRTRCNREGGPTIKGKDILALVDFINKRRV